MQPLDNDEHPDGKKPETSAGALYGLIAPRDKVLQPMGSFNTARIVVRSGAVEHWLNGVKVIEYDLKSESFMELVSRSKFRDSPHFARVAWERQGHIVLQHHGDAVWFRNLRIQSLGIDLRKSSK